MHSDNRRADDPAEWEASDHHAVVQVEVQLVRCDG